MSTQYLHGPLKMSMRKAGHHAVMHSANASMQAAWNANDTISEELHSRMSARPCARSGGAQEPAQAHACRWTSSSPMDAT